MSRTQIIASLLLALLACSSQAAEPLRLRVLTYNIHHAEGIDGKLDLPRIAEVIKAARPDLAAIQEVDQQVERSAKADQPAELARLTGMHIAFGPNLKYQGGDYGNVVLSRFPIKRHKNHALPSLDDGETRGILQTEIELPKEYGVVVFLATHFDHRQDDRERLASARQILELDHMAPALMAGDLNDLPDSDTLTALASTWKVANDKPRATFPVDKPAKQIDYVLFSPRSRWKVVETKVLDESVASDHRPLLAVLELQPE